MGKRIFLSLLCCLFLVGQGILSTGCSSSGTNENAGQQAEGTTRAEMCITVEGGPCFTSDRGYDITIESGSLSLTDIKIGNLAENREETSGIEMPGSFSVNLSYGLTDLGMCGGSPGEYHHLSFGLDSVNGEPPLQIKGIASRDGRSWPFQVALTSAERLMTEGLDVPLALDRQHEIAIVLRVDTWFQGIDFSTASDTGGIIRITSEENPLAARQLLAQMAGSTKIEEAGK